MSEDTPDDPTEEVSKRPASRTFYLRRAHGSGRLLTMPGSRSRDQGAPAPENDLILRQLQSLRQENKVILERHVRDRELVIQLGDRMERGFENVRSDIKQLRDEVKVLRSEVLSLENKLLTNQNEILDIVRRLDDAESEPFELVEASEDEDTVLPRG